MIPETIERSALCEALKNISREEIQGIARNPSAEYGVSEEALPATLDRFRKEYAAYDELSRLIERLGSESQADEVSLARASGMEYMFRTLLTIAECRMVGGPEAYPASQADTAMQHQECQNLVLDLAARLTQLRDSASAVEAERDSYRRSVYAWAKQQISEEKLHQQAEAAHAMMSEALGKSGS
jgi:hypothetical protein